MRDMSDLRSVVRHRLDETLDGKEVDTADVPMPSIPQMLGIVPINSESTKEKEEGSILDHNHPFWDDYYKEIGTRAGASREVESAIRSLVDDEIVTISTPYGNNAGIWYVEVQDEESSDTRLIDVACHDCGEVVGVEPSIRQLYGQYHLSFDVDCDECGLSERIGTSLHKL